MGYKISGKSKLIQDSPYSNGVYKEIYTEAAKRIGCKLKVLRKPKKRVLDELKKGSIDFYPGAAFSAKRAKYLYFIPNGLEDSEYGLSSANLPDIIDLKELAQHKVTWLMGLGSPKESLAREYGVKAGPRGDVTIDAIVNLMVNKPNTNYFFIAEKEQILLYPAENNYSSMEEVGLKVHKNCCGEPSPMYLGFSRKSHLFSELPNSGYMAEQKVAVNNFPSVIRKDNVAYSLMKALFQMKQEGVTDKIYDKWFKVQ